MNFRNWIQSINTGTTSHKEELAFFMRNLPETVSSPFGDLPEKEEENESAPREVPGRSIEKRQNRLRTLRRKRPEAKSS